jgi:hypothetical protein
MGVRAAFVVGAGLGVGVVFGVGVEGVGFDVAVEGPCQLIVIEAGLAFPAGVVADTV